MCVSFCCTCAIQNASLQKITKGQRTSLLYDTLGNPLAAERAREGERQREMEEEMEIGPSVLTALNQNFAPLFVSHSRGVMDVV